AGKAVDNRCMNRARRAARALDSQVVERLDVDVSILGVRNPDSGREPLAHVVSDLDPGLTRQDLDLADLALRDPTSPAQQRDQPLRISVLRATDVDREPHELAG